MKQEELNLILKEGEGLKIEFKENFDAKSIAKEMVAFANTAGGKVLLGVSDKGESKGFVITNKIKSQIQDAANNCDPPIKIDFDEINSIFIIIIFEGSNKPYKCSEGFFARIGPNSQKMKRDEIVQMVFSMGNKRFDEIITSIKEYDTEIIESYLKRAEVNSRADQSTLFNLGAADKEGNLNNGGILFFSRNPKRYIINAYISCVRYKGTEKVNVIDRKDFDEDLISQVENTIEFIKRNTKLSYEIKGLYRREIPEYPIEALREAVLNAVMHRDYFEKGANVQVDIFDDRLVITNFGPLIKPLTKENLGKIAVRRNPLIADLLHRIHLVEKIGTGINRIREECKKHGNIKFSIATEEFFVVTFKLLSPQVTPQVTPQVLLTELEKRIIEEMRANPRMSRKKIASKFSIGEDTIKEYINKLKIKGAIRRIGKTSAGSWEVLDEK